MNLARNTWRRNMIEIIYKNLKNQSKRYNGLLFLKSYETMKQWCFWWKKDHRDEIQSGSWYFGKFFNSKQIFLSYNILSFSMGETKACVCSKYFKKIFGIIYSKNLFWLKSLKEGKFSFIWIRVVMKLLI